MSLAAIPRRTPSGCQRQMSAGLHTVVSREGSVPSQIVGSGTVWPRCCRVIGAQHGLALAAAGMVRPDLSVRAGVDGVFCQVFRRSVSALLCRSLHPEPLPHYAETCSSARPENDSVWQHNLAAEHQTKL
jgi:hypothetical protein